MSFKTKDLVTASILLTLSIILPFIVHSSGLNGSVLLPMHIPVLLAGLIVGSYFGLIVGILAPFANYFLTGSPPIPIIWLMFIELALYGLVSGYLYKKLKLNLMVSLIVSMLVGRIGGALGLIVLSKGFGIPIFSMKVYLTGAFITAIPGIIIQLLFVPLIVNAYMKSKMSSDW